MENEPQKKEVQSLLNDVDTLWRSLLSRMTKVHQICESDDLKSIWREHTRHMHISTEIQKMLRRHIGWTNQAFCKMAEILSKHRNIIPKECLANRYLRSFHLCEAPGGFLVAIDRILTSFYPEIEWDWKANSLNPYYENVRSADKLLDDSFIVTNYNNWDFGPDDSGDINKYDKKYLKDKKHTKSYDFVTADGSIYTQDNPAMQESLVFSLLRSQVECALECLKDGGSFVMKMYTIHNAETIQLMIQVWKHFETCFFFKPICSKPGNSEKYLICLRFRTNDPHNQDDDNKIMADILEKECCFMQSQIDAIQHNIDSFEVQSDADIQRIKKDKMDDYFESICFNQFILSMRPSHLNWCIQLPKSFQQFETENSLNNQQPWFDKNDYNLVERLMKMKTPVDARNQLNESLMKVPPRSLICNELDLSNVEEVIDSIPNSLIISNESIVINHSMFIDPEVVQAMRILEIESLDIFSECSRIDHQSSIECSAIDEISSSDVKCFNDLVLIINNLYCDHFHIKIPSIDDLPLIASRLSASVILLFSIIYHRVQFESNQLMFSQLNKNRLKSIQQKLSDIQLPPSCYVRSLFPPCLFAHAHNFIYQLNRAQLINKLKI